MSHKDMSDCIGKSSSTVVNRVIQNSKNSQKPVDIKTVTKSGQFNKKPVK